MKRRLALVLVLLTSARGGLIISKSCVRPPQCGVARYQSGVSQEKLDLVEFAAAQTATVE